jgi:hypothetical protein
MKMLAKPTRWRSPKFLKWVRTLPCSYCGRQSDHAHHIIGRGQLGGMGTKAPDWACCGLCAECHRRLHDGSRELLDQQWEWIARTLGKAIDEKIL